jgi:hypothetical protein
MEIDCIQYPRVTSKRLVEINLQKFQRSMVTLFKWHICHLLFFRGLPAVSCYMPQDIGSKIWLLDTSEVIFQRNALHSNKHWGKFVAVLSKKLST